MSQSAMEQSVSIAMRLLSLSSKYQREFVRLLQEDSDPELREFGLFTENWLDDLHNKEAQGDAA